ncbi:MAG: hypothetical protein WCD34_15900 [Candidatus Acidiferrum sp.]|jgi:hypothetical protein
MAASATPADLAAAKAPQPFRFRIIPRIETYPGIVSFAQTLPGKALLLLLFGFGLKFWMTDWKEMTLWLAVITIFPKHRRWLVTIGMLQWTFLLPLEKTSFTAGLLPPLTMKAGACAIGGVLFWFAVRFRQSMFGRRPIFVLLTSYAFLAYLASIFMATSPGAFLVWRFATIFSAYLWFIAYALLDRDSKDRDPFGLQLGTFHPFWGSTSTPYPKGSAYLRRIEARSSEGLAITQLKGLKLLVWALLLKQVFFVFQAIVYQRLAIPTFAAAFAQSMQRTPDPWFVCWASLVAAFLEALLSLSVMGHAIIACCRMAGFAALRNTYRPLESRTIAEFWNRYYFYFKELLVDVFFYPAFMRYFKKRPKVRLFAATLAAATFGNAYYHFFNEPEPIAKLGFWKAILAYQPYLFYCLVLGVAIGLSQLRKRKPPAPGWVRGRLVPSFVVAFFYCLLHVFSDTSRTVPIQEHFRFLAHLFNLTT